MKILQDRFLDDEIYALKSQLEIMNTPNSGVVEPLNSIR